MFKKYEVPGIGLVELFEESPEISFGRYYANVTNLGFIARFSKSEEELKTRIAKEIEQYLLFKKSRLEEKLTPVIDSLAQLNAYPNKANALDSFGEE